MLLSGARPRVAQQECQYIGIVPLSLPSPEVSPEVIPPQPITDVSHLKTEAGSPNPGGYHKWSFGFKWHRLYIDSHATGALAWGPTVLAYGTYWDIPPCTWVPCFVQEFSYSIYKIHARPLKGVGTILSHASWSRCRELGRRVSWPVQSNSGVFQDSELWLQSPCSLPLYLNSPTVGGGAL